MKTLFAWVLFSALMCYIHEDILPFRIPGRPPRAAVPNPKTLTSLLEHIDLEHMIETLNNCDRLHDVKCLLRAVVDIGKGFYAAGYSLDKTLAKGFATTDDALFTDNVYGNFLSPLYDLILLPGGADELVGLRILKAETVAVMIAADIETLPSQKP